MGIKTEKQKIILEIRLELLNEWAKKNGFKDYNKYQNNRVMNENIDKNCKMITNKECTQYLGIYIAESVLFKVFDNVQRTIYGNPGFDFICNKGYKIDSKSSCIRDNIWRFIINKNEIPDYFLLLAFDNRENLNPIHIWLIKADEIIRGRKLNKFSGLGISSTHTEEFKKYEINDKLDRIKEECNKFKERLNIIDEIQLNMFEF